MDKRKELKMAYKQNTSHPVGIYQIKNTINNKIMIASSMNLYGTANSYLHKLAFEGNYSKVIKEDLAAYGPDAFSFEILEILDQEEVQLMERKEIKKALADLQEKWLNQLQPYGDKGYNSEKKSNANRS